MEREIDEESFKPKDDTQETTIKVAEEQDVGESDGMVEKGV